MFQLNLPKKYSALVQVWVSIALIIFAAVFAFAPIISLDMTNNSLKDAYDSTIEELSQSIPEISDLKMPDSVDITSTTILKMFGTFKNIVTVINLYGDDIDPDNVDDYEEAKKYVENVLTSEDGKQTIITSVAVFTQLMDREVEEGDGESANPVITIINVLIKIFIIGYLILFILVFPIVLVIIALVNIIRALVKLKTPEKISGKTGRVMLTPLAFSVLTMVLLKFFPDMSFGFGLNLIFILSLISVFANLVASRLRSYNELDWKYATLVQGSAIVEAIGFSVFFTNLLKSDVLNQFIKNVVSYSHNASKNVKEVNSIIEAYNAFAETHISTVSGSWLYMIDVALICVYSMFAIGVACSTINVIATHLGLTGNKKSKDSDSLTNGILAVITAVIPLVVSKLKNGIFYAIDEKNGSLVIDKTKTSILALSDNDNGVLVGMIVGTLIILAASIAFKVLKGILCKDITEEREMVVLCGNAPTLDETKAELQKALANESKADEPNTSTGKVKAEEIKAEEAKAEENNDGTDK